MVMGSKHGLEVAVTVVSIDRVLDMVMVCIGFILGMFMLENGPMGRAMGVVCILVRMVAGMLGNLNGV